MEAVPRMSMLSLELKESAERVEFGPVIKPYISQHYMEDENKYSEEIRQLDQLRINACNVTRDFNGISALKKYYGQLHLLTSRFPMGEGGTASLPFTWMDTFDEEPFTHVDVAYEQACILYNLGSLHSVLGAKESRSSEEEMKVACTHFQCAAGAFTYLRDHFQSDMSPDISFELMTIYINVMLGQAQECLLEKSMQDNRKSSLVARISIQVVDYYRQAMRGLDDSNISSLLGSKKSKTWKKMLTIKMNHYTSIAYMFMSNQAEEQQKYGERVAYLQIAVDKHNEGVKLSKGQHESIVDALNFTKDVVVGKFQSAKKDNDFVYHDTVPSIENLPEIKGASLVKALTFQPYDESVAGPDIFRKLVPMEAHEASSLYSEEKAKVLRKMSSAVEDKNKNLDQFMTALGVEQLNLKKQEPDRLPQVLLEVCAAISVKEDPIKTLVTSMQALSNVVLDVDLAIKELDGILQEEDKQEQEFQKEFGSRPSNVMKDLKKELSKYKEGHAKASRSNQELHKAMQAHIDNIRALSGPLEKLTGLLPSKKESEKPEDKEAQVKLQKLLDKVEEMKKQRQTLEGQLRDQLQNDDITSQIVTKEGGNMKDFFEEELRKHDTICTYIDQNLAAQDNILKAVTDANAAYADTRKMSSDLTKKREEKVQELITSNTVFDDLIAKSKKGTEFYKKLEQGITKLLSKTKGVVKVNQEERDAMIQKVRPKPAPVRPMAPKPSAPVDNAPKGPKLSDFWKPKTTRGGGQDPVTSSPQPGMYPDAAGIAAGMGAPAAGQMYPGVPGGTAGVPGSAVPTSIPGTQVAPPHHSPQHTATTPIHGVENHPGAPGAYHQDVRPTTTSSGGGNVASRIPSGSPSHPPGGMPHPAGGPTPMSQAPVVSQQPPMSPVMKQPAQPTPRAMAPQGGLPQQPTGVVMPRQQQLPPPMSPTPNQQQLHQQFPAAGVQQPPSSAYQPRNVGVVQPQQQMPSYPSSQDPASRPPASTAYVQPTVPSAPPNPQIPSAPVMSSGGTLPPASLPGGQQYTGHPQVAQQQPQQPNTAMTQRFATPHQPPQWQQQPNMPQNVNYGGQPINQPPSSMTMVSSNTTPIPTPSQQGAHYAQGQFPPSSVQGGYQQPAAQPGVQSQYRPAMVAQPGQQMPQQPHQISNQLPIQHQQQPYAPQQPQVRMQPPQQQPGMVVQQPGVQQQQQQKQHIPPGQSQQQGFQQTQSHLYHQHTGQQPQQQLQHPNVYQQQQAPGSPRHQPPPPAPQQNQPTQMYGQQQQGMIRQQLPNVVPQMNNQTQQVPPGSQQQPMVHPQQGPGGPVGQPQQQSQQGPAVDMPPVQHQQYPQQHRPSPASSPLPQQHGSPQHIPHGQVSQVGANMQQPAQHMNQPVAHQSQFPQQQQVHPQQPQQQVHPQQQQQVQRFPASSTAGPQGYTSGGITQNQPRFPHQQMQPQQQNLPQSQPQQPYAVPGGPGSPQHFVRPQVPNAGQINQQQPVRMPTPGSQQQQVGMQTPGSQQQQVGMQTPGSQQQQGPYQPQGVAGQPNQYGTGSQMAPQQHGQIPQQQIAQQHPKPMGQQQQVGQVRQQQPGQFQQQQRFQQPGAPVPPQQYPNQVPPQQQQQYNYMNQQQTPGAPLTKSQQNQKINQAFKEEQKKLPQPSLQPLKVDPKSDDLLSASPDSQQKSLSEGQLLQPQVPVTATALSQSGTSSSSSSPTPQQQSQSATSSSSSPTPQQQEQQAHPKPVPQVQSSGGTSLPQSASGSSLPSQQIQHMPPAHSQPKTLPSVASEGNVGPIDPYGDKETLDKFVEEVERLEKAVEGLTKHMLSGPTVLEKIWKELTDAQDRDSRQYSMAVARCYSMKNRQADVMPYDHNRVHLKNVKNDYINASYIRDLSPTTPQFIASQAPVSSSINDYWLMVYEQQITIIAALISHPPVGGKNTGFDQYWLEERGQVQTYGPIMLTMQSKRSTDYHVERVFNLMHKETKQMRTLFLLQFTQWPEFGVMSHPASLIKFIDEVHNYHKQQRNLQTPVLVHCNCGVGRTGVFCVIYTALQEMQAGNGIINIPQVIKTLRQQRKWMITDKEQLTFCYDAVLACAQQMLAKRGLMPYNSLSSPAYDHKRAPSKINSFDAIMGIDSIESLQDRISHMTVKPKTASSDQDAQSETSDTPMTPADSMMEVPSEETQTQDQLDGTTQPENTDGLNLNLGSDFSQQDFTDKPSGLISPDGSSTASLKDLQESNLSIFSQSAQSFIPDVVGSNTAATKDSGDDTGSGTGSGTGSLTESSSSLPSILADLTPQNFSIKEQPPSKQKATKADFMSGKSRLGEKKSADDPFSMLDPMWSIGKEKTGDGQETK